MCADYLTIWDMIVRMHRSLSCWLYCYKIFAGSFYGEGTMCTGLDEFSRG